MKKILVSMVMLVALASLIGCSTAPRTRAGRADLSADVRASIDDATRTDPGIQRFFDRSVAYAVFPKVGTAGAIVGGAYGRGEVIQNGRLVGYCTLTQADVGAQLGAQSYSELIFFENPDAFRDFTTGNFSFSARLSAVLLTAGASANANFTQGVAVFTLGQAGLMAKATIGGQKFNFQPAS